MRKSIVLLFVTASLLGSHAESVFHSGTHIFSGDAHV